MSTGFFLRGGGGQKRQNLVNVVKECPLTENSGLSLDLKIDKIYTYMKI